MSDEDDEDEDEGCLCEGCDERSDCREFNSIVVDLKPDGRINRTEEWCQDCYQNSSFYCNASGESYSDNNYQSSFDKDDDSVCEEYVQIKGWTYNEEKEYWERPAVVTATTGTATAWINGTNTSTATTTLTITTGGVPMAKALDFYWTLPKGKPARICMLIFDDREEVLNASTANKIKARIKAANANEGDPSVLNVYTRLQLIDEQLLAPEYRL